MPRIPVWKCLSSRGCIYIYTAQLFTSFYIYDNPCLENDTVDNEHTIGDATEAGTGRDSEDGSSGFQSSASSEG